MIMMLTVAKIMKHILPSRHCANSFILFVNLPLTVTIRQVLIYQR